MSVRTDVFLDAAFAIALCSPSDDAYPRARILAERFDRAATRIVTTHAVLLGIGNALSRQRYRSAAVTLLNGFASDPRVEVVPLTEQFYAQALQMFCDRPDKEWGVTDCISFVVMRERGLTDALTTDGHFEQAGFRALMRAE